MIELQGRNADRAIAPFEKPETEIEIEKLSLAKKSLAYNFLKRFFDIVLSLGGIIVLALPMLICYIALAMTSDASPIYKQERLGLYGKRFYIYKFRTMYENAEEHGAQWSSGEDDERVTPVGRLLRRIKFDELPQLFNCLVGDLSLVGPRPEREVFYACFETYIHGFSQRLLVKPGITGLAQVHGWYLKPEEKIVYDIEYIKQRSLFGDFKIILKTMLDILVGKQNKGEVNSASEENSEAMNGYGEELCPKCETGRRAYELDSRAAVCPYMSCHNGKSCTMYVKEGTGKGN